MAAHWRWSSDRPYREGERGVGQKRQDNIVFLIANVFHRSITWHAMSALIACIARLGPQMDYLTEFMDLDARFESLGT